MTKAIFEMGSRVYIIIPAYNEEQNIDKVFTALGQIKVLAEKKIIFINDGSTDKTLLIAESYKNKLDPVILSHAVNQGAARALFDGIKYVSARAQNHDIIVIIEGDNTSDLSLLQPMIEKVKEGSDMVVASRYIPGGGYRNFPLLRRLGSFMVNNILRLLVPIKGMRDYTIFYRAYRAEILKKALDRYRDNFITTKSFAVGLEILLKIQPYIKYVSEVPLIYDYGLKIGESKMRVLETLLEYKKLLIKKFMNKL